MARFGTILMSVLMLAMLALMPATALAQDGGDRGDRGDRGGDRQRGGFDREAMMQRMSDMMKERLGASDEEWAIIQPRLTKLAEVQREGRGGRGAWGGNRRGRGDDNADAPQPELTGVAKASQTLRETVENEASTPAQIKAALEALREARKEHEAEVEAARASLKEVLTLRQEAMLVAFGQLE